ncbi:NADH dehydrogenase subunit J [Fluviicoccus keumensis]|uniref:NADH-quinone oxidoreductase subunit J n=1 Tax=Fluviicoccus keumensis TaxID=1435465 RepID=A0A4V2G602_9GAMM|nr:NADH-quinone oxidoreductase subunit J [Fluviicoccus keumensis]RZU46816.1 NADH dehydrogenase subunit J [Fluviicoccus keumensis]
MEIAFYVAAAVAILATLRVITNANPVHALLNLIISLLAVSVIFFTLGAPFAGALEIIVYAGAIMVLFVFVVMMLNLGTQVDAQELKWLQLRVWVGPAIFATALLAEMVYLLSAPSGANLGHTLVDGKQVGIALFGPYLLTVELASMLLLAALVAAWHLGKHDAAEDRQALRIAERLNAENHKVEGGTK